MTRRWWRSLLRLGAPIADLPDLRALPSARVRVRGTQYLPHDPERQHRGDRAYVLRRKLGARRHATSIGVFSGRRRVGFVSSERALLMAPLLDRLGGVAIVNGLGSDTGSIRLRVDLPHIDGLRRFVRDHERVAEALALATRLVSRPSR